MLIEPDDHSALSNQHSPFTCYPASNEATRCLDPWDGRRFWNRPRGAVANSATCLQATRGECRAVAKVREPCERDAAEHDDRVRVGRSERSDHWSVVSRHCGVDASARGRQGQNLPSISNQRLERTFSGRWRRRVFRRKSDGHSPAIHRFPRSRATRVRAVRTMRRISRAVQNKVPTTFRSQAVVL
jgi:hypothetical protein